MPDPLNLLRTACSDLSVTLEQVTAEDGGQPTGCTGRSVLDLGYHLRGDAWRALVDLASPVAGPADADAVGCAARVWH